MAQHICAQLTRNRTLAAENKATVGCNHVLGILQVRVDLIKLMRMIIYVQT